jgi:C-terminal processing protease CtpA/Prc
MCMAVWCTTAAGDGRSRAADRPAAPSPEPFMTTSAPALTCAAIDGEVSAGARRAYQRAAEAARDDRVDEALTALAEAFARGYDRFSWPLDGDPDLDALRIGVGLERLVVDAAERRRQRLLAAAEADASGAGGCLVEAARVAAEVGDIDGALEHLRHGLGAGYRDFRALEHDPALAGLRADHRYAGIIDEAVRTAFAWTGTDQQKIEGLMQVFAEVEYNFAFFDRRPELDWRAEVVAAVPRVLAARSLEEYYLVLAELVARLSDGHTGIAYPRSMTARLEHAPLTIEPVNGRFVVTHIDELVAARSGIRVGDLVVAVDGLSVDEALERRVLRYQGFSTGRAAMAYGARQLLVGPAGEAVLLGIERPGGARFEASLRYGSSGGSSASATDSILAAREVAPGVLLVELDTFDEPRVPAAFAELLAGLDPSRLRGLILDVRRNAGGDTPIAMRVISHLISEPLETSSWKTPMHIAAHRAWGRPEVWFHGRPQAVQPATEPVYLGPLVVLTSAYTYSAAEDFLVPLRHSGRAILIGQRTGGSTGQPLKVYLPGGGSLRVCSKRDTFPDGAELVGVGIAPDIEVTRSIRDVVRGRDPVLARAVELLTREGSTAAGGG